MSTYIKAMMAMALTMLALPALSRQDDKGDLVVSEPNGWEYEVKAGLNIGGASPIPLPEEIREINSYNPKFNGMVEGTVTRWMGRTGVWGVSAGLRIEEKGMKTGARVKNYSTEILNDGNKVAGRWTGCVKTNYNSTLLTLPVTVNYRFNDSWKVRAGMYVSYRMDGEFSGTVYDGYLRESNPTGEKVAFTDGKSSTYDFSDDMRRVLYGAQMGATWQVYKHFSVHADLTWNFNNIFKSDFNTITFNMYPIYLNVGFGYRF